MECREQKNTACLSLATEQAVFEITGGANCPVYEPIVSDVAKNATTSFFVFLEAKKLKLNKFTAKHETEALSLVEKLFHNKNELSSLVPDNINNNIYYNIPIWKKLNKVDKLFGIFTFVLNGKDYQSFTLRFSDKFIDRAYNSKKKVASYIADRIHQNLSNNLGYVPPFLLSVEYEAVKGKTFFHIHGVIKADALVTKVLKTTALGTKYKESGFNRYTLRLKTLENPFGWLSYMTKHKLEAYNNVYVNRTLTQDFKRTFNRLRGLN
ncbi:MAG: hypothetical protein ACK5N8_06010 [Alphaproteobacteria bacterium]